MTRYKQLTKKEYFSYLDSRMEITKEDKELAWESVIRRR